MFILVLRNRVAVLLPRLTREQTVVFFLTKPYLSGTTRAVFRPVSFFYNYTRLLPNSIWNSLQKVVNSRGGLRDSDKSSDYIHLLRSVLLSKSKNAKAAGVKSASSRIATLITLNKGTGRL